MQEPTSRQPLTLRVTRCSATSHSPKHGRSYVLVHGAWFGGWVWKSVAGGLRAAGHCVHAPTLTGLGERRHLLRPGIDLDTHTDDVVNLIEMEDLQDVVLVGWSYGGMVVSNVLARIPEKIASVVYLDAFAPERGRAASSYTSRNTPDVLNALMAQGSDIPAISVAPFGFDQTLAAYATSRLSPHPVMTFLQPSKALPERPDIPHTYVLAGPYANVSRTFRPFYEMLKDDPRVDAMVMDVGHAMMLTDAAATLDLLKRVR